MRKRPYIVAMVLLVTLYLSGQYIAQGNDFATIVTTILAIVAAVAFWMEFRSNERINEAQLIMELNDQFISNPQFNKVELELEKYYVQYREARRMGTSVEEIPFGIDLDVFDEDRQSVINYLVHLEGVAALVNEGVLHLNVITDLMAYRYFIAVNNPIVQEKELLPYQEYYRGCFRIYEKWSQALGADKVPMNENALDKQFDQKKSASGG